MKHGYLIPLLCSISSCLWAQTFAPLKTYPVGADTYPASLGMGDMNKDGYPDIVTGNTGPNQPSVLLNQKVGGTFGQASSYFSNAHGLLESVAVGDVTKDGYPEVVSVDFGGTVSLQYNANRGGLSGSVQYTVDDKAVAVKLGDINNDGYLDAVTASIGYSTNKGTDIGMLNVLLNSQRFTFAPPMGYATSTYTPYDVDLADVNKDGYLDLVAGFSESLIGVYLNKRDGSFAPLVTYATGASTHPQDIVLGDLNNDGYPDVVASDRARDAVEVLLNQRDGTFGAASSYPMGTFSTPRGGAIGDVTGDGFADIVTANFSNYTIGVLRNNRDGTFAPATMLSLGNGNKPTDTALSDVDRDGKLDIVTTIYGGLVGVFLNATPLATQATIPLSQVQTSVYPNPTTGQAAVVMASSLPVKATSLRLVLSNSLGQPVYNQLVPANQRAVQVGLPTAGLAYGVYLLQLIPCDAQGITLGTLATHRLSIY